MAYKINTTMKDALKLAGGGLVGAGVALLLAPRSGKATRKEIAHFARTTGNAADRATRRLVATVGDVAASVEKKASGLLYEGREMAHGARRELLAVVEKGQNQLDRQRHRLSRMIG